MNDKSRLKRKEEKHQIKVSLSVPYVPAKLMSIILLILNRDACLCYKKRVNLLNQPSGKMHFKVRERS